MEGRATKLHCWSTRLDQRGKCLQQELSKAPCASEQGQRHLGETGSESLGDARNSVQILTSVTYGHVSDQSVELAPGILG